MSFTESLTEIVDKNESGLLGAHSSWERVSLGLVASVLNGFPFESKYFNKTDGVPLLRIRDILSENTDVKYRGPIEDGYWINKDDLLVGMDGDFNCALWQGPPALLNQRVCKISASEHFYNPALLFYALGGYLKAVNANTSSTTVKHLSSRTISDLPLPLPPLAEQHRLSEKLNTLIDAVKACSERLDRVPQILKRFREAVLEAAVSGRLTEEWRGTKELTGWKTGKAADVCEKVQSGGTPKAGFTDAPGVPFLKVYNIVDQRVAFDYRPQFVSLDVNASELRKSRTLPGDVLMNIVGPPLGKVAIVPDGYPEWNVNQAITLFRPGPGISTAWLYAVLCEGRNIVAVMHETKGSVGQVNISLTQCRAFMIPVPPVREQHEITRRVHDLFVLAEDLERKYEIAARRVKKLIPSVLAKAFRGELVSQDPNDEPASVLLERVRKEREAISQLPKTKSNKPKTKSRKTERRGRAA